MPWAVASAAALYFKVIKILIFSLQGTYHGGQSVNMFRQSGIEKIPRAYFIVWSRKK